LLLPGGDNELRAVRRPGGSDSAIFQRRLFRAQLAGASPIYVRQNQQMRAARGVASNERQLPAIGRDAEIAPNIIRDFFRRAAENRGLIYRSGVCFFAEE